MRKTGRLGVLVLTGISILFLIIVFICMWNGFLFPEPKYAVHSFNEVIVAEVTSSISNFLIYIIILFLPFFIISFFLKSSEALLIKRRLFLVIFFELLISMIFISHSLFDSFRLWLPLEQSTNTIGTRNFSRERVGMFLDQKDYSVSFITTTSNLTFVKDSIVSKLQIFGYTPKDPIPTIGIKEYTAAMTNASTSGSYIPLFYINFIKLNCKKISCGGIKLYVSLANNSEENKTIGVYLNEISY